MLIGYARVSTQDQDPTLQINALTRAGCQRTFFETASGAQRDRPQLQEALASMKEEDSLVVWKMDRLARSLRQLMDTVELLHARNMGFRSLTENIDTTTAGGKLIFHIFGALSEFERELIRERTRAGLLSAREQGRIGGRKSELTESYVYELWIQSQRKQKSVLELSQEAGCSQSTLYRHFARLRKKHQDSQIKSLEQISESA